MATLLGNTTTTGGTDFFGDGDAFGSRYQCTSSGTVDTLLINVNLSGYTALRLAIYSDSAGSPNTLLGTSAVITADSAIVSGALSPGVSVTSGTFYWLFLLPTGGNCNLNVITGGGYRGEALGAGVTTFPSTWNPAGDDTNTAGLPLRGDGTAGGTNATVTAVVADSAGSAPVASISAGSTTNVTAVVADSAGSAPVAALSAGATVTAAAADSAGSAPPANQIISAVINAPAVVGLGSAPVAAISTGGSDATVTAVVADSAGSAPVASLQSGSTVTAVVSDSAGSAPAATVTQGSTVAAVPAASHGEAPRATTSPLPAGGLGSAQVAATFAEDAA